ncbi:aminoglycoside adenylyltransferase domain-containing protein [Nocardioides cynanchi]|uniref:aminoglycoside adenylyltransferase domain-containing protein n=1 Tax=Nocardioides cynanchi TaxID=2558918 RepID=UPI00177F1622|nr:aminoglycoside adenylyltransferase domain-containing protein [Nocardioides cynanchi]
MDATEASDEALQKMLVEMARAMERGPLHRMVLNGCRVLRYLADSSVVTREEAGRWALGHWRSSDHDLIEAALARETGADKKAAMDLSAAYFFGFRVEVIAKEGVDPEDQ